MKKEDSYASTWQRYGENPYKAKFDKIRLCTTRNGIATQRPDDRDVFVKIFMPKEGSCVLDLFVGKSRELKVFIYILRNLAPDTGLCHVDYDLCARATKLDNKKVSLCVNYLLKNDVMKRSSLKFFFYVNPDLFFNGSRSNLSLHYYGADPSSFKKTNKLSKSKIDSKAFEEFNKEFNDEPLEDFDDF